MAGCCSKKRFAEWVAAAALLALAGCGGGSGGNIGGDDDGGDVDDDRVLLRGTIDIAAGVAVDNDVNDPFGQNGLANDPRNPTVAPGTELPQEIPNPVVLSGYLNYPGLGAPGQSRAGGDPNDYYRVALRQGQIVTLSIADPIFFVEDPLNPGFFFPTLDFDLHLLEGSGTSLDPILSSDGFENSETIVIPQDGIYVLNVEVIWGASNYTLSIGQNTSVSAAQRANLNDDFVVGDAIVKLKEGALTATRSEGNSMALAADVASVGGFSVQRGAPDSYMLWRLDRPEVAIAQHQSGQINPRFQGEKFITRERYEKWQTLAAINALRTRDDVEIAEPNFIRQPLLEPNDPGYDLQWHYPLINLPQAWDVTTGAVSGDDVVVAVADTGVLLDHPDFSGQLVDGYDFISDPANAVDGNGIDNNPDDPGDQAFFGVSTFHGTHVAGTVAAASDNGVGVAGVSWNAKIMPLRVLGANGGSSFDIQQAVLYAAGLPNDSGEVPDRPADIINLSLGGPGFSASDQAVFNQVREQGVIVVAAAGNDNTDVPSYPAAYDGVVSVSAVGPDKSRAFYSNFGSSIDVAAPGGDMRFDREGDGFSDGVLSTGGDDSGGAIELIYPFQQGTSMASPHVAGVAALMEAAARNRDDALSPEQFDALLSAGTITEDLGAPGRDDQYGYGMIDARKAVVAVSDGGLTDPLISISPQALNFATTLTRATLTVANVGGDGLVVTGVVSSESWLTVDDSATDGDGLGQYVIDVDRSTLDDGVYVAVVEFEYAGGVEAVPVIMQVGGVTPSTNAGYHYVLLIDADETDRDSEVKSQFDVGAVDGQYEYRFDAVDPTLRYIIVAGTDFDNDGFICDGGEACGAYITLDQPIELEIAGGDVAGLDFITGFLTQITQLDAGSGGEPRRGFKLLRHNAQTQEFKDVE